MTNKKTVSLKYAKKQFSITGIVLMIYALIVLFVPFGIKIIINSGLFLQLDEKRYLFLITLICLIIGSIFPFFVLRKVFGISFKEINPRPDMKVSEYLVNFIVYFGFASAALYANNILANLFGSQSGLISDVGIIFNESLASEPIYLFTFIILSPILEEYAFRGVLLNSLSKYGVSFALLMTTLVYSLAHGSIGEFFPSFVMGFILAKMSLTYKSIRPSLVTHILANALLCFLVLIPGRYNIFSIVLIGFLLIGAIILVIARKYDFVFFEVSSSSKKAIKLFLLNSFVIMALIMFIGHSIVITLLKF